MTAGRWWCDRPLPATGGLIQPVLTDVSHVQTIPAALRATVIGLLRPRGHRFKVTDKGGRRDRFRVHWRLAAGRRDRFRVHWRLAARFALLAGLTLAGMLYASLADFTPERQSAGPTAIVLFWSVYNIIVMLLAMAACVELPRYRREERLATSEPVRFWTGDGPFTAPLADISVAGASILAPAPGRNGDAVMLHLNEVGDVAGRIVRASDESFAVEFVHAGEQRDALIRKLYSGRCYQGRRKVRTGRLFGAVMARALR